MNDTDLTELSWLTNYSHSTFQVVAEGDDDTNQADDDNDTLQSSQSSINSLNEIINTNQKQRVKRLAQRHVYNHKNRNLFSKKPPVTLSCLIYLAIQDSQNKCLPVRDIYNWIETHFPYFKAQSSTTWKSSIRHNLTVSNKYFKKIERSEQQELCASNCTATTKWIINPECKISYNCTSEKSLLKLNNSDNNDENTNNISNDRLSYDLAKQSGNSDLEIEVASTLVRMKSLIETRN